MRTWLVIGLIYLVIMQMMWEVVEIDPQIIHLSWGQEGNCQCIATRGDNPPDCRSMVILDEEMAGHGLDIRQC
jgi:hypothetical protein